MLVDNKIFINISYRNITHYRKLGYNPILDEKLEIFTSELPSSSHFKVSVRCELCFTERNLNYCKYITNKKRHGFYSCKSCSRNKAALTCIEKYGVDNYSKTDEYKMRVEETNLSKFGYKTNLLNPNYQEEIKKILKDKYNTENFYEINRSDKINKKFKINDIVYSLTREISLIEENYIDVPTDNYISYRSECRRLTNKNIKLLLNLWDGRDYYDGEYIKDNFNLNHNDPKYPTIDHKISIYNGFVNKLDPDFISSIENICITKRSINSSKRDKSESDFNS
jgi:hypothetical protein